MKKIAIITLLFLAFNTTTVGAVHRSSTPLDGKWLFSKNPAGNQVRQWEYVSVPHSWNASDGCIKDFYRGGGRYEYTLHLDSIPAGSRAFLRFDGVSQEADVTVNGNNAGGHKGAFTAFCLEVTDMLKQGDNLIAVDATNASNPDIAPLEGDFTIFGGIYRPVNLIWLPETCITPLDYASSGTYITPVEVTDKNARLNILTKLDGKALTGKNKFSLRTTVFDPDGNIVDSKTKSCGKSANGKLDVTQEFHIDNPRLWSKKDPALYTVRHELFDGKKLIDSIAQPTGLRYVSIDGEKGFFLNGQPYNLRGVCRHQDRQGKGWAISEADHNEDMELIKKIGANSIRLAHYPHSSYFYDLCDQNGMLVWAEIPFVGHGTVSDAFNENIKQQLIELIRQNYNRPSIFCWGLFNELGNDDMTPCVEMLNETAHAEDPTRFTVAASNQDNKRFNDVPDYIAYNTYPGWYWAEPATMGVAIDWKNKGNGVCISEYGAGASIADHDTDISSAPKTDGRYHPEEWQAKVHEGTYAEILKRPFVWGTFIWNMFDFASAWRTEGDTNGMNDKGLVTYDRKTPKDAFYFYSANWSDEPVLHITSKRYHIHDKATTPVKVYTNCDNLVLTVNGKQQPNAPVANGVANWNNVPLTPGINTIKVTGSRNGQTFTDTCEWILK